MSRERLTKVPKLSHGVAKFDPPEITLPEQAVRDFLEIWRKAHRSNTRKDLVNQLRSFESTLQQISASSKKLREHIALLRAADKIWLEGPSKEKASLKETMTLEALKYTESKGVARFELLDQRRLPLDIVYTTITGPQDGWTAIKDMLVRGAPAIAIAGALSLAVDLQNNGAGSQFGSPDTAHDFIAAQLAFLVTSRPTAVNLSDAAEKLQSVAKRARDEASASSQKVCRAVINAAKQMLVDDVASNKALGRHGAEAILAELSKRGVKKASINVLTHCNTGSLATAGFGTALGVVRSLHAAGNLSHTYCTETRPYNQGARLTAFELVHDGLPATLIADSAAAALMASGRVDAIVVGADRVVGNGDTANKIGTYSLAVLASYHKVPFYIAAPTTTLDANIASGQSINIEERDASELTHHQGKQVAAPGIKVWNPSFDVVPQQAITGIITEKGLVPKSGGSGFAVSSFLRGQQAGANNKEAESESSIEGFYALDLESVKDYLADRPELCKRLGTAASKSQWQVKEVGDGNINYVYIVEGPYGALVVKQGLPYIRIDHSWKLSQERAGIEASALAEEAKHCPEHVPELYHFDPRMALLVMQYLAPPHDILRRALVAGKIFPLLGAHVSSFLAKTLFRTSLLALDSATYRDNLVRFKNPALCKLTEQVIFTDPYYAAPVNRHTSPQLDDWAEHLRSSQVCKVAATRLKAIFMEKQQALLHGDLHTGSFMVTEKTTFAIDAEFAYYGPMAFDVCKMIAQLLIAFFASYGLEAEQKESRQAQRDWILETIKEIWESFHRKFISEWNASVESGKSSGELNHQGVFNRGKHADYPLVQEVQQGYIRELFQDSLAFAGAVIIRRIVGIAHVIDFESIQDANLRAVSEGKALHMGRLLLLKHESFTGIENVITAATSIQRYTAEIARTP